MSKRTLRRYTDEELAFGRRERPTLEPAAPTVEVGKVSDESFVDPLVRLPEGWEDMSTEQIADWSLVESARLGRIQKPAYDVAYEDLIGHNGCPKGDWAGYRPEPVEKAKGCPCCYSTNLEERDDFEQGWGCVDCGYGSIESHEYIKPFATDDEIADRQPGDGWFGGGRSGKPGMYRNDEMAAGRTVYHEGEPVSAEQQKITGWEYPASWDWEPLPPKSPQGRYTPREAMVTRTKALAKTKREVRIFLGS